LKLRVEIVIVSSIIFTQLKEKTVKKTILWTLISVFTTLMWIGVGKFAYADETSTATTPAATTTTTTSTTPTMATQTAVEQPSSFTPSQVEQLHTIIKDYLVQNPQVLVEASQVLQAQQEKKMQTQAMSAIEQNKNALFNDAQSPSIGNKNASATLVEFFDYQCGHCREMAPQIEKLVSEDKNLHVVFKELPIFGGASEYAAKAALAAAMQSPEKYYKFHNALFSAKGPLTKETVLGLAKKSGLNVATLTKDMNSPEINKQIRDNFTLAQSLKIMGTPTFVIGNSAQTKFAYIPGATSLSSLQSQIKSVQ